MDSAYQARQAKGTALEYGQCSKSRSNTYGNYGNAVTGCMSIASVAGIAGQIVYIAFHV